MWVTWRTERHQNLRAHHVRVGRYFNLLDFCRSGRAVEEGIDLVPKNAENCERTYCPIPEEAAARSFAAALDPLVEKFGRVSVVRGMETAEFATDENAELHRWERVGPWRLVFVLPQGVDPQRARALLSSRPHVRDVASSRHASNSFALALVVDQEDYNEHCGLRPVYLQPDRNCFTTWRVRFRPKLRIRRAIRHRGHCKNHSKSWARYTT